MRFPLGKLCGASDLARGTAVLVRRGMVNPRRPDLVWRSVRDVRAYGALTAAVLQGIRRNGPASAIIDEIGPLSFQELEEQSNALARGFLASGIHEGDVMALLARDHRGLVLSMLAAGKIGARLLLMNTGFAKPQFADVARREKATVVLHDSEFTGLLEGLPDTIPRILTWCDNDTELTPETVTINSLIVAQRTDELSPPDLPGGLVLLTSGTTGTPKGAPRDNVSPMLSAQLLDRVPLAQHEAIVVAAPIFHGTGLGQFILGLALGNTVVLQRRFNPEVTLGNIARTRASCLVVVPTMLQRIIDLGPDVLAKYDTSTLRIIFAAGSSLAPSLCERAREVFGDVLYNMYGSTEVAVAAIATPRDLRKAPGTVGKPVLACRVELYDANRNKITTPNTIGTIFVSSSTSFKGYTDGRHKEIVNGLLCSNDIGHFDDSGLLFIDGRDDDMIVSGGENVYPLEVENVLAARDDVREAAVVGVDDEDFGKRLRAYIVPAPTAARDPQEIKNYVKDNLARYKVPRDVYFVDHLPRNTTGKLLRNALTTLQAQHGDQS
ncbi:MAG: fatty-acyl-CoA synthase [Mycobacterium sp.]|nr:fatty-acyl-CoA synthase [Mycobacterium sp.]MDT5170089.1 fatty-acyl-CoA synthase [Mycobacterium sp.]